MVASGLTGSERVSVSQYRLAFHLTLACAIYAAVCGRRSRSCRGAATNRRGGCALCALAILLLVLVQIYFGALVAGLDAGLVLQYLAADRRQFCPGRRAAWFIAPAWRNLFENTLTVQFDHRMMAYAIWLLAMFHANDAWDMRRETAGAILLAGAVTLQAALGIVTLLNHAPIPLALAHQVLAILVLTVAVMHAERLWHRADTRARQSRCAEVGAA